MKKSIMARTKIQNMRLHLTLKQGDLILNFLGTLTLSKKFLCLGLRFKTSEGFAPDLISFFSILDISCNLLNSREKSNELFLET